MSENQGWMCVAWAPYSRRSEAFAKELGGPFYGIHYLRFQEPLYAPFKYIPQAIRTLFVLFRERPRAVHVFNPPFGCGQMVDLYARLTGAPFVLDHHSAAFLRIWSWARPIQKYLARRAAMNIVTNRHWEKIVQSWGGETIIIVGPVPDLPPGRTVVFEPGFHVACISIFSIDEPLEAVVGAASLLPEIRFYITGDSRRASQRFLESLPPNVSCTGFLPEDQYVGLLRAADAIMCLTTRDHTLQLGGIEAVAVGKPLLTSDWPFLREVFSGGTVFVPNTVEGIKDGLLELQARYQGLREGMKSLRHKMDREWKTSLARLQQIVDASP